ncbi:MAG: PEP-CTERM sorting domain-containing protein, partial [Akkermansia sp.]
AALGAAPTEVPEPATATLSLLALAGLAVRRRRKQA